MQEPRRIVLKETSTVRLSGRKRKVVVNKTKIMYIPLLDTLQSQLNNDKIYQEVNLCNKISMSTIIYTDTVLESLTIDACPERVAL